MKKLMVLFTVATLALAAGVAQARDIGLDEAFKLQGDGAIKPIAELTATAQAQHPGGKVEYSELEDERGRLIFQAEVRDAQGLKWDVDLDAVTGQVLKNKRDD